MASMAFSFVYQLGPGNVVMGASMPGLTVTTIGDATLTAGEAFSAFPSPIPSPLFSFASGDGIVATDMVGGMVFLFTNTAQSPGATATNDGSSFVVCFLAGTRIATPTGEAAVEDLAIGDLVLTADGRTAPVRWVGVQSVVTFFADRLRTFPVRIMAGALGEGLPVRDLLVSPDHALMLDGVLVQAGALVNGTTILRETAMPERFTYFHVELDDHSLILAEGVPAETFVDNVTRRRFDNFAEYEALYGDTGATIAEMDVPRVKSARQLPAALRERLAAGAASVAAADTAA